MALKNAQYDIIMKEYNHRQFQNKHLQDEHIQEAYAAIPRLEAIDQDIASLSLKKAKDLLFEQPNSFDLPAAIKKLSKERQDLLKEHGFPSDYLEMHYTCPICQDTGYVGSEKCTCFKKATINLLYAQSNMKELLEKENFKLFSFDYYSDRIVNEATGQTALDTAKHALGIAKQFVANFDITFDNIFFYGDTGVGKTFLSHCIAKELIDSSHCVIYFSAYDLFEELAKSAFSREKDDESNAYIFDCDLLIIDDLGTELTNSFVASQLFLCVNERIQRKKPTIISTNLTIDNFIERYSERIFSRISSNYSMLKLIGEDIRIQKRLLGGKK
ncbi:MAG: ATP-binding protein [Lachnospiraceae bacterium]|nr:ATP-binding protein [Lachnospiraceae bacterium]MDD3616288.1 ATP-binding protein [Lachnospiraceae bacterium]